MSSEHKGEIVATTLRTWELIDGSKPKDDYSKVEIPAGEYPLEIMPNPYGYEGFWLVLEGTKIGMAAGAWKQWQNGQLNDANQPIDWGESAISIRGFIVLPEQPKENNL